MFRFCFALLLLAVAAVGQVPEGPVDRLTDAEVEEALSLLKAKATFSVTLSDAELKRATLRGLLGSPLPRGALLAGPATPAAEVPAFRAEVLEGKIGYLRLGALNRETLTELDSALAGFVEKGAVAQVLDLRALPSGFDPELCAALCQRWCPKGQALFSLARREEPRAQAFSATVEPVAHGLLIVLVDARSAGSAEVAAAVLRGSARALLVGQKTKGEAGEFAEKALGSGPLLRFPAGEVSLPWPEWLGAGVWPDLLVEVMPETEVAVLKEEAEKGAAPLLVETERPRLNEAALVAGRNPELDALEAAHREPAPKAPLHDAVLARAVDVVTSLGVFGSK